MGKPRVLGIGIVGIGGAAVNMLPAFDRSPFFKITAACDIDPEILGRFGRDCPAAATFSSIEQLCASPTVDLVYIGTPTRLHRDHACMALAHGKHVLIEKPMAMTLDEADAMIAAAEQIGVMLGVNVKHSFEPRIQRIRAFVRSGELGRLKMIQNWRYVDWLYQPRTRAERTPQGGAGILWRQGPHQFDLIRTVGGGLVRSVRGTCHSLDPARGIQGAYSAFLEFESGATCTVVCSGYDHFDSSGLVHGFDASKPIGDPSRHARARRTLEAHLGEPDWEESAAAGERYGGGLAAGGGSSSGWLLRGPLIASFEHGDVRLSRAGLIVDGDRRQWEIPLLDAGDGRDGRLGSFYRAITNERPLPADGRWGKATQEVLVAMERSSLMRQDVLLEHQAPYVDDAAGSG
jgi:phthalate 4,5-cis-dihydrodiol dehydrogenase